MRTMLIVRRQIGFSLIETAIVLVIMAAAIGAIVIPMALQVEANHIRTAKNEIVDIKEALLGFYINHHRFPCPATESSGGEESPIGGGACTIQHGFVPATSLGISGKFNDDRLLVDPWNNPYRYSISSSNRQLDCNNATAGAELNLWDFTSGDEIKRIRIQCLNVNLNVCLANGCTGSSNLTPNGVPIVIFSMGKNWAQTLNSPQSSNEIENVGDSVPSPNISGLTYLLPDDMQFVSATYNEGRDNPSARFDDIVDWISPNVLYNRMVMAGIYP